MCPAARGFREGIVEAGAQRCGRDEWQAVQELCREWLVYQELLQHVLELFPRHNLILEFSLQNVESHEAKVGWNKAGFAVDREAGHG